MHPGRDVRVCTGAVRSYATPASRLCPMTWVGGLSIERGGVDRAPWLDPRAPEVTRTQKSAKNEWKWDFRNQRVEGVQKSQHLPCIR